MNHKKVLITGFDPFGGESVNPAYEAVKRLPEKWESFELYKKEIPTIFGRSLEVLKETIEEINSEVVICVGQAGGYAEIAVERVGINLMDAKITDNSGYQPEDEEIVQGGEAAYFSTIPTRRIVEELHKAAIPAKLSYSAGTFVCNQLLYGLLDYAAKDRPDMKCGFIHVPYIPDQVAGKKAGTPSMSLEMITKALGIVIQTAVD